MANTVVADLVVEDGTGLANANTYVAIATVDEYHRLRCNELWAELDDDTEKVPALIRATDYVDRRWNFIGTRLTDTQALHWPIVEGLDCNGIDVSETVPAQVEQAVAEYALRAAADLTSNPLLPDPEIDGGGFITRKFEKVGPLEEETEYDPSRGRSILRPFPLADRILLQSGLVLRGQGRACR